MIKVICIFNCIALVPNETSEVLNSTFQNFTPVIKTKTKTDYLYKNTAKIADIKNKNKSIFLMTNFKWQHSTARIML